MDYKERLRLLNLGLGPSGKKRKATTFEEVLAYTDSALSTSGLNLARWMAENFNKNFDAYDRAIDSVYNATRIGGSMYHHLLDGQHTIPGAFRAVRDVSQDDTFVRELAEALEHLLRDVSSVSGINPLFSLTSGQFERLAEICSKIGISKPYLADILTVNGPELIGGALGLVASVGLAKDEDQSRLSFLSGSYIVSALITANPLLAGVAAAGLIRSMKNAEDKKEVLIKAGKGSIVSGGSILLAGLIGGPLWLNCMAAVSTAATIKYMMDNPRKALERAKSTIKSASKIITRVSQQPEVKGWSYEANY